MFDTSDGSSCTIGVAVYIAVSAVCIYSLVVLIRVKQRALRMGGQEDQLATYPALAGFVLGKYGTVAVSVIVVVLELAFCTGWVIIISTNITLIAKKPSEWQWTVALLSWPVLAALACIRFLKDLWFLSIFGLLVYLVGVMGSVYYYVLSGKETAIDFNGSTNWEKLPQFVGVTVYGMEAILLCIPVEASMRQAQHAAKVIAGSTSLYALSAALFGGVGYAYGLGWCKHDKGNIVTDCLPDGALATTLRVALVVAVAASFPVLLYPVNEILEGLFLGCSSNAAAAVPHHANSESVRLNAPASSSYEHGAGQVTSIERSTSTSRNFDNLKRSVVRCLEVLLCCLVAAEVGPNFNQFANVIGALLVPIAGFMLPAVLDFALVETSSKRCEQSKGANYGAFHEEPAHGSDVTVHTPGASVFNSTAFYLCNRNRSWPQWLRGVLLFCFGVSVLAAGIYSLLQPSA